MKAFLLIGLFLFQVFGADVSGICGNTLDDCSYEVSFETKTLTVSGNGNMGTWSYDNPAPWYPFRSSVTTIKINYGIKTIGYSAFRDFNQLTSVSIPKSVNKIMEQSFQECSSLKSVVIPSSVNRIYDEAFYKCNSLEKVEYFGTGFGCCKEDAFEECNALSTITVSQNYVNENECTTITVKNYPVETCGDLTREKGIETIEPCDCVENAVPDGDFKCKCIDGFAESENKCLPIISCGSYTKQKGSTTNVQQCQCVDDASLIQGTNECECKQGYLGIDGECKKLIKCGDYTNQKYASVNIDQCTCVDLAQPDGQDKCKCVANAVGNKNKDRCECDEGYVDESDGTTWKCVKEDTCGDDCNWSFDYSEGELRITGSGSITNTRHMEKLIRSIKKITIGHGIKEIDAEMFKDFEFVEEISIPYTVVVIGKDAFALCRYLKKVTYLGVKEPSPCGAPFSQIDKVYVTDNYTPKTFCGKSVEVLKETSGSTSLNLLLLVFVIAFLF